MKDEKLADMLASAELLCNAPEVAALLGDGNNEFGAAVDVIHSMAKLLAPQAGSIQCVICMECITSKNVFVGRSCVHVFHETCAKDWAAKGKDTCPVCSMTAEAY